MALFKFEAVHAGGRKTVGVIEADSLASAKERLRQQQMLITHVAPYQSAQKKSSIPFAQLLDITRMLGQLLHAGIPLYETLIITEEKYHKAPFHPLLVDLCDRVKKGESFSLALSHYPHIFDPVYTAMVKAGEEAGSLTRSFQQLTHLLEDKNRLKKQLIAAATYPLFLASFCIVVFLSLLIWVIPSLKNLFEGRALHPLTQFVFQLSDFFLGHSLLIFTAFALIAVALITFFKHPRFKMTWDKLLLKIPLLGPLMRLSATVRYCRTCSLLLEGGTPLLQTLSLSRAVLKNQLLEEAMQQVEKNVSEGDPLSLQIEKAHWMPPLAPRMLAVGERTGQNGPMFRHIATLCEEDLTRALQRYTSLLQPLLLLVLGLLIGTVILSILIPLTDVGSVLSN